MVAVSTASASDRFSRTSPRSVLWAMPSPLSLATTGKPISVAAALAAATSPATISGANGMP